MDGYRVQLPDFHGPIDLLLHLVKKNELDIRDLPIAAIADQFRDYLNVLQAIDIESIGEFLVAAATLMEIKSRMLLPRAEPVDADADVDPRHDLVRHLIEYRQVKEAAARLEALEIVREQRLPRAETSHLQRGEADAPAIRAVELWDLVSAFGRIMQEAETLEPAQIASDDTPQHVYRQMVLSKVLHAEGIPFRAIFEPPYYRLRLIGLFLAILELVKDQSIILSEREQEIWLLRNAVSQFTRQSDVPNA